MNARHPLSLANQAAALVRAVSAALEAPKSDVKPSAYRLRRMAAGHKHANELRRFALSLFADRQIVRLADCEARRAHVRSAQWAHVFKTLVDAGLVARNCAVSRKHPTQYFITDAGRAAIAPGAQHPLTTGDRHGTQTH